MVKIQNICFDATVNKTVGNEQSFFKVAPLSETVTEEKAKPVIVEKDNVQQTASETTKPLEEETEELQALKEKYLPMIRTNYKIAIREVCRETADNNNLSEQDVDAIASLIYEEFEKKMELSKEWDTMLDKFKRILPEELWATAMKHQIISNINKVQVYKPQMVEIFNEVYSAFKEAEKTSTTSTSVAVVGEKLENHGRGKNKH